MKTNKNERVLKLSHDDIQLVIDALSIADKHYSDIFKKLCENVSRGNDEIEVSKFYWNKACTFNALQLNIGDGVYDI
jgi:hypothetical protein